MKKSTSAFCGINCKSSFNFLMKKTPIQNIILSSGGSWKFFFVWQKYVTLPLTALKKFNRFALPQPEKNRTLQ